MANSTALQRKWNPIVESRRTKPKTNLQALIPWLKIYEEAVIESESRSAAVQNWGLQEYTLLFLFLLEYIDCTWGGLTTIHNLCFEHKYENYRIFFI